MDGKRTRKDKFEKRRRNTKSISMLLVVSVILLLSLIGIWIFGGGSDEAVDELEQGQVEDNNNGTADEDVIEENDSNDSVESGEDSETSTIEETDGVEENEETVEEVTTEVVESSDENVKEAIVGDWKPVGTAQEGPHTVDFNNDSQDRLEMKQAILLATGLQESDYHEWWVGNGGDQKVIATVSDEEETGVYRVYISWIDNEGWQPTKVELLIENDWEKYQ